MFSLQERRHLHLVGNMESDSVNENFSPIRPSTRRSVISLFLLIYLEFSCVNNCSFEFVIFFLVTICFSFIVYNVLAFFDLKVNIVQSTPD